MLSRLVLRVQRLFGAKHGELSIDDAAGRIGKPGVFFFDVNPPERYRQGHVPGAKNFPAKKVGAGDLPADKNATLVFYCTNSM